MKKLLIAAAASAALFTAPNLVSQSLAAPAKSAFCDLAKAQRNPVGWNAYYHCLGNAPKVTTVVAQVPERHGRSPYCNMANAQRNPVSWNAHYGCLSH